MPKVIRCTAGVTARAGPGQLRDGEAHTVSWPRRAKLLDVLLDAGLDAPFSCREGHCGACACTLRNGKVSMEVNDVLEQQDLDDGLILACQSHPESDSVEVTYDE